MNTELSIKLRDEVLRNAWLISRNTIEGAAELLSIPIDDIPVYLNHWAENDWWGCADRFTTKDGWFLEVSPPGSICE